MVMVGMFPTMIILMHLLPGADNPYHLLFWGVMSVATIAGMLTAYPINSWMVKHGLKHGMMSAIPAPEYKGMDMSNSTEHKHDENDTSSLSHMTILVGTSVLFFLTLYITNLFVPIHFVFGK